MTVKLNNTFEQWAAYYADHFASITDDALKGYWWMYGRDSDTDVNATPRDLAAWAEVNAAMQSRGL